MEEIADLSENHTETASQHIAPAQPLFSRILAPTDFSHRSQAALDYAERQTRFQPIFWSCRHMDIPDGDICCSVAMPKKSSNKHPAPF